MTHTRVLCWFSCGVSSTVAALMAIEKYGRGIVELLYTDPGAEHPDNVRYMRDVEKWLEMPIKILRSNRYSDIWDVFEQTRYLVGPRGARCTTEMKKAPRLQYQRPGDIHVFGFNAEEDLRAKRFGVQNRDVVYETPLIDAGITKADCLRAVSQAGIELPAMYRMGYRNNNCIGCVKGGAGYWNKIRVDFPEVYARMAHVELVLGIAINKRHVGVKRERVFLKDLPPGMGRYETEPDISCGAVCEIDFSRYEPDTDDSEGF